VQLSKQENCNAGPVRRLATTSGSERNLGQTERTSVYGAARGRPNPARILFVHDFQGDVARCLNELRRARFVVNSDIVTNPEQFAERVGSQFYDVIVAAYPSASWLEMQLLEMLGQMRKDIPVIFLVHGLKREAAAELVLKGAADCVELDYIGHLPVAVHRALDEKALRDQRDRAERELRRSQAHYRALAGNLIYGICRCGVDGRFLEVNDAMVGMLGYGSRKELLALDLASDIIQNPDRRAQLLGQSGQEKPAGPLELEWKRKDHTTMKV